jgi:hypothetical protein
MPRPYNSGRCDASAKVPAHEQQSFHAFVDHGVQTIFDAQIFHQAVECRRFPDFDEFVHLSA